MGGGTAQIPLGPYVLDVVDEAGTQIRVAHEQPGAAHDGRAPGEHKALRKALAESEKEQRRRWAPESLESATDAASDATTKVERAKTLCTQLTSGEVSLDSISSETDALVGLLGRLDRAGRWEEELRLARSVSTLLSLARRWLALLRSLQAALHAAEKLDDANGKAWALHELGTLHLAVEDHAVADDLLGRARELRERCGDRRGLAVTERNLQILCRSLRARLHERGWPKRLYEMPRSPLPAFATAALLLAVGGSAGAVIGGSRDTTPSPPYGPGQRLATAKFSFLPSEPHVGEPVKFQATASGSARPVVGYKWDFGDHDPSEHKSVTHIYRRAGTFKIVLLVSDARGKAVGEASASVRVLPKSSPSSKSGQGPRSGSTGKQGSGEEGGDQPPPSLSLECPPERVRFGGPVDVVGTLSPPQSGVAIHITVMPPEGEPQSFEASTETGGAFQVSTKASREGSWAVHASTDGTGTSGPAEGECEFTVQRRGSTSGRREELADSLREEPVRGSSEEPSSTSTQTEEGEG